MSSQPYPRTWTEFLDQFSTEDACLAYLEGLRWPNGFICPSCGVASVSYRASRIRMMCKDCAPPEHRDGGNDLRQDPHPAAGLAGCGLVPDQPEAGPERLGAAAGARAGQLPDRLGDAVPVSPGDGAARSRSSGGWSSSTRPTSPSPTGMAPDCSIGRWRVLQHVAADRPALTSIAASTACRRPP